MIQSLENIKKSVSEFPSLVPDLKEYLDNRCTHFRADCTIESISNWQMITSEKEILTSVRGVTIEFDTQPYDTKRLACVANVSSRGSSRKLRQEQKKE